MSIDIKKQIKSDEHKRYALSVVSGQEQIVVENLKERIKRAGLENDIVDFMIPIVPEIYKRWDKKIVRQKKLYPGYVFVKSKMNDKIWNVLRNTPGVRLIVGADIHPIPLSEQEYNVILQKIQEKVEKSEHAIAFKPGDVVELLEGDFKGTKGRVSEVDFERGIIQVIIELLGRSIPVVVDFDKVKLLEDI